MRSMLGALALCIFLVLLFLEYPQDNRSLLSLLSLFALVSRSSEGVDVKEGEEGWLEIGVEKVKSSRIIAA